MKTIRNLALVAALALSGVQAMAATDVVLDEIKHNLSEAKNRIDDIKKQIRDAEENESKIKKNIETLDKTMTAKNTEKKDAEATLQGYSQKITATGQAKKEFEKSLSKDKAELDLVTKDIANTEKKLAALKAAEKALKESIEVSDENLSKIDDRSGSWLKNKDKIQAELKEIEKDIEQVKEKRSKQAALATESAQALAKWRSSLTQQENTVRALEAKYKAAVNQAERAEQEKTAR